MEQLRLSLLEGKSENSVADYEHLMSLEDALVGLSQRLLWQITAPQPESQAQGAKENLQALLQIFKAVKPQALKRVLQRIGVKAINDIEGEVEREGINQVFWNVLVSATTENLVLSLKQHLLSP